MWPWLKILRPQQWIKNLILLFPPFFGGVIQETEVIRKSLFAVVVFCLASSATYVVNDLLDAEKDLMHPTKKNRPIPSGALSPANAWLLAAVLLALSLLGGYWISSIFLFILLGYIVLFGAYSFTLKDIIIVDIFCVAAGFLLRLQAGSEASAIPVSEWLFLTVFLLAVFLSAGKRMSEKHVLGEEAHDHRPSLADYEIDFLNGIVFITASAVLVTYTIYVLARPSLVYTVPLCCYGLFRYIFRIQKGHNGDPTISLLCDRHLLFVGVAWLLMIGAGIYF